MKTIILVTVFCCASLLAEGLPDVKPLQPPAHHETTAIESSSRKRQTKTTSYTTNIVHDNESEDGKSAQSSISVNFGQNEASADQPIEIHTQQHQPRPPPRIKHNNQPQPQINLYPTPKTIHHYVKQEVPQTIKNVKAAQLDNHPEHSSDPNGLLLAPLLVHKHGPYLQEHAEYNAILPQPQAQYQQFSHTQGHRHHPHFPVAHHKSPQLFNVGYSINIMNHEPKLQFRVPTPGIHRQNKHFRGDQIITGSHKDTVGRPSELNIIPSYHRHVPVPPDFPIHHTSSTHIHHHVDEIPANYINLENDKKHTQVLTQTQSKGNYVWKSLSPGVEISGYLSEAEQSNKFDHAGALGRSEGFDISNVVDTEGHKSKVNHQLAVSLPVAQHLKSNFEQPTKSFEQPAESFEQSFKSIEQPLKSYEQPFKSIEQPIKIYDHSIKSFDHPQFEKQQSIYKNKEFLHFDKYLKNLRHNTHLFRPEPNVAPSGVHSVRFGPNFSSSGPGSVVVKPYPIDQNLQFAQAATFDQKYALPNYNYFHQKFLRPNEPLPPQTQKLVQPPPPVEYETQEVTNEESQQQSQYERFPPLEKVPLDTDQQQSQHQPDKFPPYDKIPKDGFRQGRYVIPTYKTAAQPYRMRIYQRDLLPQYMVGLRPPPMLIRVPKYVQ